MAPPKNVPSDLFKRRAGAFVSIHENGRLRGCIGTFLPVRENIADEIIHNAAAAATEDPRFQPISKSELDRLDISVDILSEPEPVASTDALDAKRYGVIVTCGSRRGLLLPDLDGVDTPEQQIAISRQKAGISPDEPVSLMRFEVNRHEAFK
jgi:AmmeMemoRadiSam system protein A